MLVISVLTEVRVLSDCVSQPWAESMLRRYWVSSLRLVRVSSTCDVPAGSSEG